MNVLNLTGSESLVSCFQSLLFASAIGSVVVLLAIAFHVATAKWVSATWLYALWFVVLLRFILFATPESPTSLLNLVVQPEVAISTVSLDARGLDGDERLIFPSDSIVPIPIDESTTVFRWSSLNYWTFAAAGWLVVVFGLLVRLVRGYLSVKKLVRDTSEPSSELLSRFENLKQQLGMRQRTRLRISNELEVPAMAGLFRSVVILPVWCCHELDDEQLELVFTHELIHVQRGDGFIQLIAHLILVLHWFNPLVRIAARFIESTRELSCDRRVIETWKKTKFGRANSGSTSETLLIERKYGQTILDIAGRAHSTGTSSQFNAAFLGGFTGSNQNLIKQRIAMLVNSRSQLWLRNVVAAGFVSLLLAVGFTSAQTVCPPCPPAPVQVLPAPQVPEVITPDLPDENALLTAPSSIIPPVVPSIPLPAPLHLKAGEPAQMVLPKSDRVEVPRNQSSDSTGTTKAKPLPHSKPILLHAGETKRLKFNFQIPEIMVDDPAVVTATPVSPKEIQFAAIAPGTTEVHVFNPARKVQTLKFRVVPDVRELKSKLKKAFPGVTVGVTPMTDGFVNLFGQVTTEQVAQINEFVIANCDLPIRNQLTDKDPIAIKIKVFEVSTTKLQELGIDWPKTGIEAPVKSVRALIPEAGTAAGNTLGFGKVPEGHFDAFLETLERHNIAKLLDQPILVANHGRTAEYFNGDKVPIAVINEKGQPTIEFRSYGTKIQTTPHIHSKEEMTLEVRLEVSEVAKDLSTSDGTPGFRVRRVNTGIRLNTGGTLAFVCEYKSPTRTSGAASKKQIHGDKEETELVFLITPRLIEKGPEFKLTRQAAAIKKDRSESSKTNSESVISVWTKFMSIR